MPIPGLKTVIPDGAMSWPLTLIEGEQFAGKTWALVEFLKQCEAIGEGYWIALDEGGHARMYGGRLPGKDFELVPLETGDYNEVLAVVRIIKAHAASQHAAGEKPVCLVIDSVSGIWSGLHDWVNARHKETRGAKRILAEDPNADVGRAGRNLWNDADARWTTLVRELKTFPGLVLVTARGKEISATDPVTGQPAVDDRKKPIKTWSVEVKRGFEFYVDLHVRMRREEGSFVVGVRSVEHGAKPGSDEAKMVDPIIAPEAEGRMIEWLLFDVLGLDPATAYVNDFREFSAGGFTDAELAAQERALRSENAQVSGQSNNGRQGGQPAAPRKPTAKQVVERIAAITDPEQPVRELWKHLNGWGMLPMDSGVDGYTLEELLLGRRDQLLEAAKNTAKPAPAAEGQAPPEPPAQEEPPAEEEPPPPDEPEQQAPANAAAVVNAAWGTAESPAVAREVEAANALAQALEDAPAPTNPDPKEDCKASPARRGILSSLEGLVANEEAAVRHFGRPLEQVATRKLRDYVQHLIAAQKNSLASR